MRVLVIDDEPDVLLLCRVNFEFAGHEVIEAPDGATGLTVARERHPDAIVLDVMLPRQDGFQILGELRSDPETAETPIVMLTAKTQGADQLRGFKGGVDEYVTKPFSPTALTTTVERVVGMTLDERKKHREQAAAQLSSYSG
jgi:two-component system alkaline phosphatase synthesis response regulator PhoP